MDEFQSNELDQEQPNDKTIDELVGSNESDALPIAKPPKRILSKRVKLAAGTSITVVLLALIVIIVLLAVFNVNTDAVLFSTTFSYVSEEINGDVYIAIKNGEYVLMKDDRVLSGGHERLERRKNLYIFMQKDTFGVMDKNGKVLLKSDDNLFDAVVTEDTYTIKDDKGEYKTVFFADGKENAALKGLLPYRQGDNNGFLAKNMRFAVVEKTGQSALKVTSDNGVVFNTPLSGNMIAASQEAMLFQSGSGGVLVQDNAAKNVLRVADSKKFFIVDNSIYSDKLDLVKSFSSLADAVVVEHFLEADGNVYKYDENKAELHLLKEKAKLIKDEKSILYIDSNHIYNAENNKKLATKESDENAKFEYIKWGYYYDGTSVKHLKDKKVEIKSVESPFTDIEGNLEESRTLLFNNSDGDICSLKGVVVPAKSVELLEAVYRLEGNFVAKFKDGLYINMHLDNPQFIALNEQDKIEIIPETNALSTHFVIIKSYGVQFYKMGKEAELVKNYAAQPRSTSVINGGIVVEEEYQYIIFNKNGNTINISEKLFDCVVIGKDYFLGYHANGTSSLYDVWGNVLIKECFGKYKMVQLDSESDNAKFDYYRLITSDGMKVLKVKVVK